MYKGIFLDIDGTIMSAGGTISPLTKQAISQLQLKGIKVVLATGRPLYLTKPVADELAIASFICYNGGMVFHEGKKVYEQPLDQQSVKELINISQKNKHPMLFFSENKAFTYMKYHLFIRYLFWKEKLRTPSFSFRDHHRHIQYSSFIYCKNERTKYEGVTNTSILNWREDAIEVAPKGRTKANRAKILLDYLQLKSDETVAFGDQINDMELFDFVGCSIAMGTSYEHLAKKAPIVTKKVEDDGVYHGLKTIDLL